MDKASAERLAKVHPVLGKKVAQLIANCADRGIEVRVVQGLRTFAEQDKLYNQPWDGKDNDGDGKVDERDEKVTNARGGFSNHNYGLATDVCPFKNNKPDWNDLAAFKIISVEAKKLGLESGADWKFVDRPHVQLKGMSVKECQYFSKKGGIEAVWNRMSELLRGAPANIFTPSADDLLEFGDIGGAVRQLQQQLISLGFMFPHELDGNFGKITKNAVIGFQRQNRLTADGIVGPGTKAKLAKAIAQLSDFRDLADEEIILQIPTTSAAAPAVQPVQDVPTVSGTETAQFPANVANNLPDDSINSNTEPPPITTGTIEQTRTQTIDTPTGTVEETQTQKTDIFNAANIPAFIPRFGKQWLFGLVPGAGFISTVVAYLQNAPQWLIFLFGVITGATAYAFIQLAIKHREIVGQFIISCYKSLADPAQNNLIPTNASGFVGTRNNALVSALNHNAIIFDENKTERKTSENN